jgi:hypothetical protein
LREEVIGMAKVYLSDLAEDKQTDSFLGKGTEALKKEAEEKGIEVVVGEYFDKLELEE